MNLLLILIPLMSLILHSHEFSWVYSFLSCPSKYLIVKSSPHKRNAKFRSLGTSYVHDRPVQSSKESLLYLSLDILFCNFPTLGSHDMTIYYTIYFILFSYKEVFINALAIEETRLPSEYAVLSSIYEIIP